MAELPVQDVILAVLFSVVLVFNIAGNSLVIHIITNERGMKTSTNYLLLNLAVADILFGVFLAPWFVLYSLWAGEPISDGILWDWLCKLLFMNNFSWLVSKVSIFTMSCLSVERYFAVCRPHSFKQRFSSKIVKMLVMASWIYAVIVASPLFVQSHFDRNNLLCSYNNSITAKAHSIYIMLETICFLSLMVFFLTKICMSLWWKQTVETTGEREITERIKKKKVTLCVVAVVITSIVCWIPDTIMYLMVMFAPASVNNHDYIARIVVLVASVNAALDPYLFSFQSSRFKKLAKKVLCCRKASS